VVVVVVEEEEEEEEGEGVVYLAKRVEGQAWARWGVPPRLSLRHMHTHTHLRLLLLLPSGMVVVVVVEEEEEKVTTHIHTHTHTHTHKQRPTPPRGLLTHRRSLGMVTTLSYVRVGEMTISMHMHMHTHTHTVEEEVVEGGRLPRRPSLRVRVCPPRLSPPLGAY
jgi:hypothetical protein